MAANPRPDLGRPALFALLALVVAGCVAALFAARDGRPGSALHQGCAVAGAALLLAPALFSFLKRAGLAASPPTWFVVHVLASAVGCVLVFVHAAGGDLLSPPGLLLLLLAILVIQGVLARALLATGLANRFAAAPAAFLKPEPAVRQAIARIVDAKRALLARLDPAASEAVFSPRLSHWLGHPILSLRYHRLAAQETRRVGARARAGPALSRWRGLHLLLAWLFLAGLLVHVVVVTFFAGYVAQGGAVYWWHVSAWGGP